MFACAIAGVALMSGPRGPAMVAGGGSGGVKLVPEPLWMFEPKDKGEIRVLFGWQDALRQRNP
jgi:hypothetical protein